MTLTMPCFSEAHATGRGDSPAVAPKCNMQCNYCNRDFEMRERNPGRVLSGVQSAARQAADYLDDVLDKDQKYSRSWNSRFPGTPSPNPAETMERFVWSGKTPEMNALRCHKRSGLGRLRG